MLKLKQSNNLTPLDLKIISYIENNVEKVAFMRIRDLAKETYTSAATVLRCVKKIGFDNYPEFRLDLQKQLKQAAVTPVIETGNLFSFQTTFEEDLNTLSTKITQADTIYCSGIGNSRLMAEYASNLLATIGYRSFVSDATLSAFSLNHSRVNRQTTHEHHDVFLFFSASGESHEIVNLAKELDGSSIHTVSLSSQSYNTLANYTSQHFHYNSTIERTPYNLDLSSQLPVVYFIESLINTLK